MRVALAALVLVVASTAAAEARVLHVSNFGQDGSGRSSSGCGAAVQPCRSLTQAIINAADGDTVVVGPGIYGDLNRNGVIGEPGEESGDLVSPSCGCLVHVDKRITVLSQRGAAQTTIDARGLPFVAVLLFADGAVFGYAEHGFTVLPSSTGIAALDGTVWGNRIIGGMTGISGAADAEIYQNEIMDAQVLAMRIISGRIVGNTVTRSSAGISVSENAILEDNTIADNRGFGVRIDRPAPYTRIIRNLFIRNAGPGVELRGVFGPNILPSGEIRNDVGIYSNDFIGNDPARLCGIDNAIGGGDVWATHNYWAGAADFNVASQTACNAAGASTHIEPTKSQPHLGLD